MPVASKFNRNENHLMLLAVIARMDGEGIDTDVEKLSELGKFFKSQVEYMLENLLEEGLVKIDDDKVAAPRKAGKAGAASPKESSREEESTGSAGAAAGSSGTLTVSLPRAKRLVQVHDFSVTPKGQALLEEKKKELARLSVAMQRLYNKKDVDELYRAVMWNREWIPLMLYTGVLTTAYLREMMKLLGLDMYRLSMTETQERLDGLGLDPELLSMGLMIVHPLLAIASYIISIVTLGKLEERAKPEKAKKAKEAKGRVEGELYIPKTD